MGLRIQRFSTHVGPYQLPQTSTGKIGPQDYVADGTAIKDHSREIKLLNQHRLKAKNKVIAHEMGEEVYFFKKLETGRRCSCFDTYSSPDANCPICLKSGVVGGYLKYGTYQNILDATYPGISAVGVHLSYEAQLRPLNFVLDDGAKKGVIFWRFDILQTNTRVVDGIRFLYSGTGKNATVKVFVKRPSEITYILATKQTIAARLDEEYLDFKIEMERANREVASPKISHYQLRYLLIASPIVRVDIQNVNGAISLEELGYFSNVETAQAFFDSTIPSMTSNDFMYRVSRHQFWKPITVTRSESLEVHAGYSATLRFIQPVEPYPNILV